MAHLLVHSTVEGYAKWKSVFDAHSAMRKTAGSKRGRHFRSVDDPNEVWVLFEWDDIEKARAFGGSAELREAMQEAPAVGGPEIHFLEEHEPFAE